MNRVKVMEVDNSIIYEDLSFKIFLFGLKNADENIEIMFVTNPSSIYRTSDYKTVLHPPRNIPLLLSFENLLIFTGVLINCTCQELNQFEDLTSIDNTFLTDNGLRVNFRVPRKNEKFKLIIDIFEGDKQIVSFTLQRTKILLLLMMFKDSYEKLKRKKRAIELNSGSYIFTVYRKKDAIGFNEIWLRNSEVEILRYLINSLVYDFKIVGRFASYQAMHRQVLSYRNTSSNKFVVILKKYIEPEVGVRFSINTKICAALFLIIPTEISFKGDYSSEY